MYSLLGIVLSSSTGLSLQEIVKVSTQFLLPPSNLELGLVIWHTTDLGNKK